MLIAHQGDTTTLGPEGRCPLSEANTTLLYNLPRSGTPSCFREYCPAANSSGKPAALLLTVSLSHFPTFPLSH